MIWMRWSRRQAVERSLRARARAFCVLVAVEADRGLADALDDVEDRLALLVAHRVAEDAAEQADVVAERKVLVGDVELVHRFDPWRVLQRSIGRKIRAVESKRGGRRSPLPAGGASGFTHRPGTTRNTLRSLPQDRLR